MRFIMLLLATAFIGFGGRVQAQTEPVLVPNHQAALEQLNYLLAVDRLEFYSEALADYLDGQNKSELAQSIREILPEDIFLINPSPQSLNKTDEWNKILLAVITKKNGTDKTPWRLEDLTWNYNFFKNKLMEGFKADLSETKKTNYEVTMDQYPIEVVQRSVPNIKGKKILLDAQRYISEKTTRAIYWDGLKNNRSFEFHIGTERDFRQRIKAEKRQIISEVKTRANNYNKIYLVYDPQDKTYSYAFSAISGDDRITHLMAQLRIASLDGKFTIKNEKVKVYGNAGDFHKKLEAELTDLYKALPKADLVVIGQKSAIENVIQSAQMLKLLQPDLNTVANSGDKNLDKVITQAKQANSYFVSTTKGSVVKAAYEKMQNKSLENFRIVDLEKPSHDMVDMLLETQDGSLLRWRLISNMWGDEVTPIAKALKNSGVKKVVYIGTAGAIKDKGYKVGDVVSPEKTYNQKEKLFDLKTNSYGKDFVKRGGTLGQVKTPFDETDVWLQKWSDKIDFVELETGYLKENLGEGIELEPYLLISDIVGSEHETLAVAAADASKRKNGQLKLLESLFIANKIKAPISDLKPIIGSQADKVFKIIDQLRPSRDTLSKVQLTQLALRQGVVIPEDLEKLIQKEPAFDRAMMLDKLEEGSRALKILTTKYNVNFYLAGPQELLSGTWNPKKPLKIQIMIGDLTAQVAHILYKNELDFIQNKYGDNLRIEIVDAQYLTERVAFNSKDSTVLEDFYTHNILNKFGLQKEYNNAGGVRYKQVPEAVGGFKCSNIFQ